MAPNLFARSKLLFALFVQIAVAQNYPFCDICKCTTDNGNVEVSCTRNVNTFVFNPTSWMDSNNKTYPYFSVKFHNTPFTTLEQKFPITNITYLDFSHNSVVNISNGVFSNLQDMVTLTLSYNNIEIIDPEAFDGQYLEGDFRPLKSLKNLHLDHNRLTSLSMDVFEHTSRIEVLTLSHNPFKLFDQHTVIAITSLVFLKKLDLSYAQLKSLPDNFLHTPKYLSFLDLSGNLFEEIPKTLGDSHNLTTLYFDNNMIVNLTSENGFPSILTLKSLHLSEMSKLQRIENGSLSKLENLEEFYCFQNPKLAYIDKQALCQRHDQEHDSESPTWPPIKKLYLQDNKLTRIDMGLILHWQDLIELDLTENAWTCECENQWIVDELMPIYIQIDETKAKSMKCAAPIEMKDLTFYDEYKKESTMRCLDLYGHRPERDGVLLIGILAGVLITIPLVLFLIYAYQRNWFGFFDNSAASFSRQFYKRTTADDMGF